MLSKSDQLANLSTGYLNQSTAPSAPTLLNTPTDTPASQLSFSAPGTQMSGVVPKDTSGQTWVPGVGMLGADLGGAVKGTMMRQDYGLKAAENNRAEETLGLAKTKLAQDQDYMKMAQAELGIKLNTAAMESKTFEHEQAIQEGMVQAAQNGGFGGVIDYLKNADPAKAVTFQAAKLKLDSDIAQNETYQLAHSQDKTKAMLGGYQALGSFGATLMNTPADKRAETYKGMLPILKQVDPNMPNELNQEAVAKMTLGMSLSTPANLLYDGQKAEVKYQGATMQAVGDLHTAVRKYGPDSKEAMIAQQAIDNNLSASTKNQVQMANTIAQNKANGESGLRAQWLGQAKTIQQVSQANTKLQQAFTSGANSGPNDMAIVYNYIKMLDPTSTVGPGEKASAENTKGVPDSILNLQNKVINGTILTDKQRKSFAESGQKMYEGQATQYYALKDQFKEVAVRNNYNPDNVIIDPLKGYAPLTPSTKAIELFKQNPSPENQQMWQLRYGQDSLNKMLQETKGAPNGN